MRKKVNFSSVLLLIFMALSLIGCKKEKITLSTYELWFPAEAGVQDIQLTANCDWTISIDDDADWYSIRRSIDTTIGSTSVFVIYDTTQIVSSGNGSMTLAVVVEPLENTLSRTSSFTITSAKGKVQIKVDVAQNTMEPLELQSITNFVFGVKTVAHWNTDYFGDIIEDSYIFKEYDPYDTTKGYFMYFLEEGQGVQADKAGDSTVYYLFTYDYNPAMRNLHIEFETMSDTVTEVYDASVFSATEESFQFCHEYKPNFWERADMEKIGTNVPQRRDFLLRKARKREGGEPIFRF